MLIIRLMRYFFALEKLKSGSDIKNGTLINNESVFIFGIGYEDFKIIAKK